MKTYEDFLPPIVVSEFSDAVVEKFRNSVLQEAVLDPKAPIVIYVDSDGGEVDAMASMIEVMQTVPNPIYTVCSGRAYSAAAILLSFGDKRFCGTHSTVMIHEFSSGAIGHIDDLKNQVKAVAQTNHYWNTLLAQNCGLQSYKELKTKLRTVVGRDLYLTAEQAKQFGIVDEIGLPDFKLKSRKTKQVRLLKRGRK